MLKCLCGGPKPLCSLHLPILPFAGPSLETHTVSRIRAVPPQENPKSHPSDARTTNSAAQGTKVQFWIDLGIISEPSDPQQPLTFNGWYCKSSISALCGSCRSRIVPGPPKTSRKRSPGTPKTPPELPKGPQGAPRSSPRDSKNFPQSTPRGHMVAPTASYGATGAFWT